MFAVPAMPCLADSTPEAPLSSSSKPGAVRVEGVIQDDSGGLLPGAKLHFAGDAGFTADVVADRMGSFHIDLAPGTYRVSAVKRGISRLSSRWTVHPRNADPADADA